MTTYLTAFNNLIFKFIDDLIQTFPEENDFNFAKQLSQLGDYFVNDAFSCSHRAHASTEGITKFIPSFSGPMLNEEILALKTALENPQKPSLAIIGGAKVSSKISVLKNLVSKLDGIIIGGGMAYTFLAGNKVSIGESLYEKEFEITAKNLLKKSKELGLKKSSIVNFTLSCIQFRNTLFNPTTKSYRRRFFW